MGVLQNILNCSGASSCEAPDVMCFWYIPTKHSGMFGSPASPHLFNCGGGAKRIGATSAIPSVPLATHSTFIVAQRLRDHESAARAYILSTPLIISSLATRWSHDACLTTSRAALCPPSRPYARCVAISIAVRLCDACH